MTLPDTDQTSTEERSMDINTVFKELLLLASNQERVVAGLYDCVQLLQTNPENISLCVLPIDDAVDDMVHMQHVLVEAYCREHRIHTVKVDSSKKLEKLLLMPGNRKKKDLDFSCVVVLKPKSNSTSYPGTYLRMLTSASSHIVVIPV